MCQVLLLGVKAKPHKKDQNFKKKDQKTVPKDQYYQDICPSFLCAKTPHLHDNPHIFPQWYGVFGKISADFMSSMG